MPMNMAARLIRMAARKSRIITGEKMKPVLV
jgi:hypothetical protein